MDGEALRFAAGNGAAQCAQPRQQGQPRRQGERKPGEGGEKGHVAHSVELRKVAWSALPLLPNFLPLSPASQRQAAKPARRARSTLVDRPASGNTATYSCCPQQCNHWAHRWPPTLPPSIPACPLAPHFCHPPPSPMAPHLPPPWSCRACPTQPASQTWDQRHPRGLSGSCPAGVFRKARRGTTGSTPGRLVEHILPTPVAGAAAAAGLNMQV